MVGRHPNLRGDLHLDSVSPVGVLVEVSLQNGHLRRVLAHAFSLLPLVHVLLLQHQPHFRHVLLPHLLRRTPTFLHSPKSALLALVTGVLGGSLALVVDFGLIVRQEAKLPLPHRI